MRDNFGLELRVSNADRSAASAIENLENGAMREFHPFLNPNAAAKVRSQGEATYFAQLGQEALEWVVRHPGRFMNLTLDRFVNFWTYADLSWRQAAFRLGVLALAAAGFTFLRGRDRVAAAVVVTFLALYPLPYYVVQGTWRYRYPTEWIIVVLATYAVVSGIQEFRRWRSGGRLAAL